MKTRLRRPVPSSTRFFMRSGALALLLSSPVAALAQQAPLSPAPPAAPPEASPAPAPAMPPPEGNVGEVAVPAPPPGENATPPLPPPPEIPPTEPAPAGPTPSTVDDRVGAVEGKVGGLEESLAATASLVDRLNRIKVSGYIQGRYEWHGDSSNYLDAAGNSKVTSQFLVRRGRLKVVYDGKNAEYLLQIDAVGSGVTLKDAEATLVDTWTPFSFRLTVGQFKWPFGYEVLQSSGDREMPERSLVIRKLFPGERDRGVRLTARHDWLRLAAALVNGNGTQDPQSIYRLAATDQNGFKDLVARVGGDFGVVVGGLSAYWGRRLQTTPPKSVGITWIDRNMDKAITSDEISFTPSAPASYKRFSILRLGADVQAYVDVPGVGGLALKGEFVYAKDTNLSFQSTAADPCADRTQLGWIVTAVQNVGDYAGVVVRVDSFDPNFTTALADSCTVAIASGIGDRVTTYGGGVLLFPSANLKGTFTYEHVAEQTIAVANDIFTAQLQARF